MNRKRFTPRDVNDQLSSILLGRLCSLNLRTSHSLATPCDRATGASFSWTKYQLPLRNMAPNRYFLGRPLFPQDIHVGISQWDLKRTGGRVTSSCPWHSCQIASTSSQVHWIKQFINSCVECHDGRDSRRSLHRTHRFGLVYRILARWTDSAGSWPWEWCRISSITALKQALKVVDAIVMGWYT